MSGIFYKEVTFHSQKYLIGGGGKDQTGNGVPRIAVKIGTEIVLSDSKGEFPLRSHPCARPSTTMRFHDYFDSREKTKEWTYEGRWGAP